MASDRQEQPPVDPEAFLRALLNIRPDDAETVRERTPGVRPERPQRDPPSGNCGDENDD